MQFSEVLKNDNSCSSAISFHFLSANNLSCAIFVYLFLIGCFFVLLQYSVHSAINIVILCIILQK